MVKNKAASSPTRAGPADQQIAELLDKLAVSPDANLIGVLQDVQDSLGYLSAAALEAVSKRTKIPLSRVYGVVSFYAQFYTEPRGRHTILCCRGTACHVNGAQRIVDSITAELGVQDGQTTDDALFYLETVACLGTCFLAPAMMIDSQYFGNLTERSVVKILKSYRADES